MGDSPVHTLSRQHFFFLWGKTPEFPPQSHTDPLTSQRDKETDQLRPPAPSSGWRRMGIRNTLSMWRSKLPPEAAVLTRGVPLPLFFPSAALLSLCLPLMVGSGKFL